MKEYQVYPRFRYLADGTSVLVNNQAEEDAIEGDHFDLPDGTNHPEDYSAEEAARVTNTPATHVHHEYPKFMRDGATIVESEEEETAWLAANGEPEETEAEEETEAPKKTSSGGKGKKADGDDLL